MSLVGLTCGTSPWYTAQSLKKTEISAERLDHLVKIREQSIKTLQQEIVVSTLGRSFSFEKRVLVGLMVKLFSFPFRTISKKPRSSEV